MARHPRASAKAIKSIYLMTDLEGCAGVDDWDPRHHEYVNTARYIYERSEMQRLLTGEVNACVEGCLDAGVETVIVNDAHGAGRTILIEELHPRALLVKGKQRPRWWIGLERCDAIFHVGMHAISDTPAGTLCHTMSKGVKDYRINGRAVSEFDLAILIAGELGLPAPFLSGERNACRQARRFVPGIVTVETKEGLSIESAIHRSPIAVRAEIRERSAAAIEKARQGKVKPVRAKSPCTLEIEMREPHYKPEQAAPWKTFVNSRTMRWHAPDIITLLNFAFYNQSPRKAWR
ncbi:MAG: M55 family metallopeptidase [Planctomycetota bacterium]|nr:M55 family metallopeptidase [Planctomycetota bacterium]